jgi:hypothetical protein
MLKGTSGSKQVTPSRNEKRRGAGSVSGMKNRSIQTVIRRRASAGGSGMKDRLTSSIHRALSCDKEWVVQAMFVKQLCSKYGSSKQNECLHHFDLRVVHILGG